MRERPIAAVPKPVLILLALALFLHLAWHVNRPHQSAQAENLQPPPSLAALRLASLGDPIALSKLLMLYIQAFDNQPGVSVSFRKLDYSRLQTWLTRILELAPPAQYPLFAASRLYAEVSDPEKQRLMYEFVYQQFLIDPDRRWPWLAHVTVIAKHRLKDLPLARKYAQAIRLHASGKSVPQWAKQMEIFILEDMDELASAKILLGGLLQGGQITDPHELLFLEQRLNELERKSKPQQ